MSGLNKIEKTKCFVSINGEQREVRFVFSTWAKIEKKYGSISNFKAIEKDMQEKPFETLPFLIYSALVNKEGVTEETCLDDYDLSTINEVAEIMNKAMIGSMPVVDEKESKN